MPQETLYSAETKVRVEPAIKAAVELAARSLGTRPAEYIRQALRDKLKADGVAVVKVPA